MSKEDLLGKYYQKNKDRLKKKASKKYQDFSEEEKKQKWTIQL